ncbi:Cytochrome c family protein [hydrothermal vent metagenome]|uniref:Cytochrome c family protein n=1 Tax=hydrothermal vent metagenome TaxID=652676 RepID=A0A3B1ARX6_9ZZZZ
MWVAIVSICRTSQLRQFPFLAVVCLLGLFHVPLQAAPNTMDRPVLHPAIPLLDESGDHVLDSGKPYSPRMSCGNAGCHDYESITHAYHFEMGRDEASDDFGALRGLPQLVSPGYFGGYACMGGSNPEVLAKKVNASADDFADKGSAGLVARCISCHSGGGWMEKDRNGNRYDEMDVSHIATFDGDYYNRGTDANNQPADSDTVALWDWKKSGVLEADCFICHADFTQLTKTDPQLNVEGSASAYDHFRELRRTQLVREGFFYREAASAILEFLNLHHAGCADDVAGCATSTMTLLNFARDSTADTAPHSRTKPQYALLLDTSEKPQINWNPQAFDSSGKVQIPMLRFPGNDNCMMCHRTSNSRRGFYGFGEGAAAVSDEVTGIIEEDYQDDVHKGKTWIAENGESRRIENCNACHSRNYFKRPFDNVDLSANHNILKGNSDMDVRNDLDYAPNARSCEYCHNDAPEPVIPSGQDSMLKAHLERWKHSGVMAGYPRSALERITQTHLDVVACQSCHITGKKSRGRPINPLYRYRQAENGDLKIIPYNPRTRYYWKDRNSGRVLNKTERNQVFKVVEGMDGNYGAIVDPASGIELARVSVRLSHGSWRFGEPQSYNDFLALKRAYDKLLQLKGVENADAVLVWTESNEYIMSHNTRPAVSSLQCSECHSKKQDGSFSALLSPDGLFGEANRKSVTTLVDPRLIDEGLVILDMPYMKVDEVGEVTVNVADILYQTLIDPSMTVLRSARARQVSGLMQRKPVASIIDDGIVANAADAQKLQDLFGNREIFVYQPNYGDASLRSTVLLAEINGQSNLLYPSYRFEFALAADSRTRELEAAGQGALVSPLISLLARDHSSQAVTRFDSARLLVRLPYRGSSNDLQQLRVVTTSRTGQWVPIDSANIVVVQPQTSINEGYLFFWTTHFSGFAVTDVALGASTPPTPDVSDTQASGGGAGLGLVLLGTLALFQRRRKLDHLG